MQTQGSINKEFFYTIKIKAKNPKFILLCINTGEFIKSDKKNKQKKIQGYKQNYIWEQKKQIPAIKVYFIETFKKNFKIKCFNYNDINFIQTIVLNIKITNIDFHNFYTNE